MSSVYIFDETQSEQGSKVQESTMLFFHFHSSLTTLFLASKSVFISCNSVVKVVILAFLTSQPLFRDSTVKSPSRASKLLFVGCNGLSLLDVVFTQRPQRQFALWPQLTQLIHQTSPWCSEGNWRPKALFFITIKCHTEGKTSLSMSSKVILISFSTISHWAQCRNKTRYHLQSALRCSRQNQSQGIGDGIGKCIRQFSEQVWRTAERQHFSLLIVLTPPWELPLHPPTILSGFNFPSVQRNLILLLPLMLTVD